MARGLQAALLEKAQQDEAVREAVANGKYQLVYMSPKAMLLNLRWREMFRSVSTRGTSRPCALLSMKLNVWRSGSKSELNGIMI